jgi:hypothetical protein
VPSLYGVEHIRRHQVSGRDGNRLSKPGQHPLLSIRLLAVGGPVVAVHTHQPHQSTAVPRISLLTRPIVVDERNGTRQRLTSLSLSPVDDLDDVGSRDVVGVGPAVGRRFATSVQVDPEPRLGQLPAAIALVNLGNLHIIHVPIFPHHHQRARAMQADHLIRTGYTPARKRADRGAAAPDSSPAGTRRADSHRTRPDHCPVRVAQPDTYDLICVGTAVNDVLEIDGSGSA